MLLYAFSPKTKVLNCYCSQKMYCMPFGFIYLLLLYYSIRVSHDIKCYVDFVF